MKVLIIKDDGKTQWKLPGGTPEKNETPIETLKREVFEEATVTLEKCKMIGCQETEIEKKIIYQLRYVAIIEEIKKHTIDSCDNKWVKRKFIDSKNFNRYVKWGDIGREMFKVAYGWFEKNEKKFLYLFTLGHYLLV